MKEAMSIIAKLKPRASIFCFICTSPPPTAWVRPSNQDSIWTWECKTPSDWEPHLHPSLPRSTCTQAHHLPCPATLAEWCSSSSSQMWWALFPRPSASETHCRALLWNPRPPTARSWMGSSPQTALRPQLPFLQQFELEEQDFDSLGVLVWEGIEMLRSERSGD